MDQEKNQYESQSTASSKDERVDETKDKDKTADNDDLISKIGATVSLPDHFESPLTNLDTEIGLTDIDNGIATKTTVSSDFFTSVQPNVSCENAVDRNDLAIFSLENDVGTVEAVSIQLISPHLFNQILHVKMSPNKVLSQQNLTITTMMLSLIHI